MHFPLQLRRRIIQPFTIARAPAVTVECFTNYYILAHSTIRYSSLQYKLVHVITIIYILPIEEYTTMFTENVDTYVCTYLPVWSK